MQVELARLLYERSRLVRTWTHLERQRGGRGFLGGPGETQLEADKRMIDRAVGRLRSDLEDVKRTRRVQREGRKRRDSRVVALVGYTNAGKSTLFNRLTGADVMAKDMPFATLDTTISKLDLPVLGEASLVDTVGFISDLPTHLVDSFRATLEEALEADLLIHVRDRSSDADEDQKRDVLDVLQQLADLERVELAAHDRGLEQDRSRPGFRSRRLDGRIGARAGSNDRGSSLCDHWGGCRRSDPGDRRMSWIRAARGSRHTSRTKMARFEPGFMRTRRSRMKPILRREKSA